MTGFDWNAILRLPDAALAGDRRIPKAVLVRQAGLTRAGQRILDRVGALSHFATVQKSTTRIPPAVDADHDIRSVLFLRCELARGAAYAETARLLHGCFPNPTVILFGGEGTAYVSAAGTRRSLSEHGASVVDRAEGTGAFDPRDPLYAPFLEALDFRALPQADLKSYTDGIVWAVRLARVSKALGFCPSAGGTDRARVERLLDEWEDLSGKEQETRRQWMDRSLSLNDSAHLRITLRQLERRLDQMRDSIREACNG